MMDFLAFGNCIPVVSRFSELQELHDNNTDFIDATYTALQGDVDYFNFEQMPLYEDDEIDSVQAPSDWDGTTGTGTTTGERLWLIMNEFNIKIA